MLEPERRYHEGVLGQAPITVSVLRHVRRRWMARRSIACALIGAAWGAGFTLAGVTVARLSAWFPLGFAHPGDWAAWAAPLGVSCAAGGVLGGLWAMRRPPSLRKAAWMADSHHDTRDALGGAIDLMLAATIAPDQRGFAAVHLARAEAQAAKVNPPAVVPFTPLKRKRSLRVLPLLILATAAAGVWLPTLDRSSVALTPEDFRTTAPMSIETQVVQEVTAAATAAATSFPLASAGELDSLRALEEELRGSPAADRGLGERAAGLTEQVASRLDEAAKEARAGDLAVRRELQERMKQAARGRSDLEAAMRAGDLAGAAAAAEELARQARSLPAAERARVAEDLKRLADALGGQTEDAPTTPGGTTAPPAAGETTSGPGASEASPTPPEAIEPAAPSDEAPDPLDRANQSAEQSPRTEATPSPRQPSTPPPTGESTRPTSPIESLRALARKAAEELRQPAPPAGTDSKPTPTPDKTSPIARPEPPQTPRPSSPGGDGRRGEPREGQAPAGEPSSSPPPSSQPPAAKGSGPQPDAQQGERKGTQPPASGEGAPQQPQPAERPPSGKAQPNQADPAASPRSGGTSGGTTPTPERIGERTTSPEPGQKGTETPASSKPASQSPSRSPSPTGGAGGTAAAEPVKQLPLEGTSPRQGEASPQTTPMPQQGTQSPPPGGREPAPEANPEAGRPPSGEPPPAGEQGPSAMERMAEQLRRMQQSGEQAERMAQQSESLRRQARELLERMTPQQRQEPLRMARQAAEQGSGQPRGQEEAPPASQPPQGGGTGAGRGVPDLMPGQRPGGRAVAEGGARPMRGGNDAGRGTGPVAEPRPFGPRRDLGSAPVEGIDARRMQERDPGSRTVAEWDSPPRPGDVGGNTPRGPVMAEGLNEAARGAQRAIETQQVPAQYTDLVRRVFRRYVERAAPPPPADGSR